MWLGVFGFKLWVSFWVFDGLVIVDLVVWISLGVIGGCWVWMLFWFAGYGCLTDFGVCLLL